jgi:hypothetical protein
MIILYFNCELSDQILAKIKVYYKMGQNYGIKNDSQTSTHYISVHISEK